MSILNKILTKPAYTTGEALFLIFSFYHLFSIDISVFQQLEIFFALFNSKSLLKKMTQISSGKFFLYCKSGKINEQSSIVIMVYNTNDGIQCNVQVSRHFCLPFLCWQWHCNKKLLQYYNGPFAALSIFLLAGLLLYTMYNFCPDLLCFFNVVLSINQS